jgi:integrase
MLQLPHGARCSKPKIYPANWQGNATLKKDWYIKYRFYCPSGQTKQVVVKGMNSQKTLSERRDLTRRILAHELQMLRFEGYNPITRKYNPPVAVNYVIDPDTPFSMALHQALKNLKIEPDTKRDIGYVVAAVKKAAIKLDYDIAIKDIRKRHLRPILDFIENTNKRFTDNTFNHYRKYLGILFTELEDLEATEVNPAKSLKKRKIIKKDKVVLTMEERSMIDNYLSEKYPSFHRFLHIFFHSGGRERELMALKVKDVDLINQRYKALVKKGKESREVWRTIKDIALPLWEDLLQDAPEDYFVFSRGLKPGLNQIRVDQITKRWYRLVKQRFGVKADFYSLKHINTTETVDILDAKDAARQNGHTSEAMVVKIYDVGKEQRQHKRLKGVNNPFVQ